MALEPIGYIFPRRPPVPNGMTVQKTSSSCFPFFRGDLGGDFGSVVGVAGLGEPAADHGGGIGRDFLGGSGLVERM